MIPSDLFTDYTLRTVALGSGILGIVSGTLGSFAVLRKQSLLGDAMSHAALPGIAVAFLLTRSKSPLVMILGAAVAGWIGTLLVMSIVKSTRIKYDTALGMILSVFFGIGLVLLTFIQKIPDAAQAGLDKFLFGQAAAMVERDVVIIAVVGAVAILIVIAFWKEFKLMSFDRDFGSSLGFPIRLLDILLTSLLVVAIVLGLQTVGVVLMSAMIVAPAAAARQWTDRMSVMVVLSALFGLIAGVSGAIISSSTARMPTGPTIVLCISAIVFVSMLFAPNRGLVWAWVLAKKNRRQLRTDVVLSSLYSLALQHGDREHAHPASVLQTMGTGDFGIDRSLGRLEELGLVYKIDVDGWVLTASGFEKAEKIAATFGELNR